MTPKTRVVRSNGGPSHSAGRLNSLIFHKANDRIYVGVRFNQSMVDPNLELSKVEVESVNLFATLTVKIDSGGSGSTSGHFGPPRGGQRPQTLATPMRY